MQGFITLLRRCLAMLSAGIAIAMLILYLGLHLMPQLGIHGTLKIGFNTGKTGRALASLCNPSRFYASIHLNYPT
ncbi:hypothetical protein LT85_3787 [Collimonas arenae]|uniref:Uncharacterized protein n=1 Tax=Collimonas arenae TaxID=279058 RepID=A0A0A1FGU5_9BURK|nr:hypothetical protein [Collimonas arenae]AIY42945.1 hypothetical protein LT85_3787 [Collimonas arenae]